MKPNLPQLLSLARQRGAVVDTYRFNSSIRTVRVQNLEGMPSHKLPARDALHALRRVLGA
jgi:hypothetical protein